MKIPWSLKIEEQGLFITEIECEIECEVWREYGHDDPAVRIEAIWREGDGKKVDLLGAANPGLALLALAAKEQLESDMDFLSHAIDQSDWWRDGDARNPSSKWREAS